ncbi:hypothetical protein B8W95_13345, partial [Staphylococcus pasteuri]
MGERVIAARRGDAIADCAADLGLPKFASGSAEEVAERPMSLGEAGPGEASRRGERGGEVGRATWCELAVRAAGILEGDGGCM